MVPFDRNLHNINPYFSIVIVALPAGIIASGFVEELDKQKDKLELEKNEQLLKSAFYELEVPPLNLK